MSANRATRASVLRSPPPPRRTGIFLTGGGLSAASRCSILASPSFGGRPGEDPRGRQAGQQVRGPQERPALGGRQLGEQAFLVVLYLALHRLPDTASVRGDRQQPGAPVRRVWLARDQARRLQFVQRADDAGLVRADLRRQGGLG